MERKAKRFPKLYLLEPYIVQLVRSVKYLYVYVVPQFCEVLGKELVWLEVIKDFHAGSLLFKETWKIFTYPSLVGVGASCLIES